MNKVAAIGLLLAVVIVSLLTLRVSPLPWYDEVDFASIATGFTATGKFICTANDLYFANPQQEVLYYGPVYFVLTSKMMSVFGFGIVQFRLINFLAGVGCIPLLLTLYASLTGKRMSTALMLIFSVAVLSDYTFFQDMHSGRMDLVGLLFMLAAMCIANKKSGWLSFCFGGFLVGLSLLTTPRMYIIGVPYFALLILYAATSRNTALILKSVFLLMITVALFSCWLFFKFGGIVGYLEYLQVPTQVFGDISKEFFRPAFSLNWYQVAYLLMLLLLSLLMFRKVGKSNLPPLLVLSIAIVGFYLLLGGGSVIYFSLIAGMIYLVLFYAVQMLPSAKYMLFAVIVANLTMLTYKMIIIAQSLEVRNTSLVKGWLHGLVPGGSKVVADDQYFYAVVGNGCQFQYLMRGGTTEQRINYQARTWKAEYLVVADTSVTVFREYRNATPLKLISSYLPEVKDPTVIQGYVPGYQGYLFRFVR